MFNTPRALGGFPILALHPKALRQIWNPLVFWNELRKCVRTSHGRFVFYRERITVDARVCQYASTRRFACAPFLAPKALRQIWNPWFFGTNSGSVYEPLMGRFVLCWERSGDRSIGGANLRKGRQPLLWKRHCRPFNGRRTCAWLARLAPGVGAVIGSVFAGKFKICTKLYDFAFC